jgi:hypothetical protein
MAKKKRLSHDQKRKAKLARREKKAGTGVFDLAYEGDKFKSEEYIPLFMATETGIFQAHVMSGRRCTDYTVATALASLVQQLRAGPLPELPPEDVIRYVEGQEAQLIVESIRRSWDQYLRTYPHPGTETLMGVLRTLLGSIQTWGTSSRQSTGYLRFLEGFLRREGVSFQRQPADGEVVPVEADDEDELLEIGRDWCEGIPEARAEFLDLADERVRAGEGYEVAEICQQLLGEYPNGPAIRELSQLSGKAQRATVHRGHKKTDSETPPE